MLIANVNTRGNQQTIKLTLYYHLPEIIVRRAVVFGSDFFRKFAVPVCNCLNLEIIDSRRRFKQKLSSVIEAEYRRF
ncbi:unnamed protein product [marine sediment metagenome]|uniref:Uncharacterized protein n=1 Tax=marine sediment metagenome TaxID=412755 RepID=X0Z7N0_9ZZZZ